MEELNINKILNREEISNKIKEILNSFEENKNNLLFKRGIYIYGTPGSGKTSFIMNILRELNCDVVKYDAGDIRNKSVIDTITKSNISDKNIMSLFHKKIKKIVIVMDEIDGMNNGDKGGINALIKLIRPKKTKKQKLEDTTVNPIICIGNYYQDKKIKELIKVCHSIELKSPTSPQIMDLINKVMPTIEPILKENMVQFIQGDLRKLNTFREIYKNNKSILKNEIIECIFQIKQYNDDTKQISQKLIQTRHCMDEHDTIMNETDRTIVGLLWHENVVDVLAKMKNDISIPIYLKLLDNICFADYIDRITFQKQIWQFNEMSSIIKTFKNNKVFHDSLKKKIKYNPAEVRFTKVLTKYSTEYNNSLFIQNLCYQLGMDKKDLFAFFLELKNKHNDVHLMDLFINCEISKLDIQRMYRYLDKYTKRDAVENECDDEINSVDDD
jgi:DNA polymerase III delta prime subunit